MLPPSPDRAVDSLLLLSLEASPCHGNSSAIGAHHSSDCCRGAVSSIRDSAAEFMESEDGFRPPKDSLEGEDAIQDLQSVICEFPLGDEQPGAFLPVKSLASAFESAEGAPGMSVYLRIRPIQDNSETTIRVTGDSSICTSAPDTSKRSVFTKIDERHYAFTRVFGADSSQGEIFEAIGRPLLLLFQQGEDCLLFAYGMTNAGKVGQFSAWNQ